MEPVLPHIQFYVSGYHTLLDIVLGILAFKTSDFLVAEERPSMKLICRVQYRKDGKTKSLRLVVTVASEWEDVARQLNFDEAKITTFRKAHPRDPKESAKAMHSSWTMSDVNATWAKLIQALEGASDDLAVMAKEFKYALINKLE